MIAVGQKRRAPSGLVFEVIIVNEDARTACVKELRPDGTWSLWPSEEVTFDVLERDPVVELSD